MKTVAIIGSIFGGIVGLVSVAGVAGWFFVLRAPSPEDQCAHMSELLKKELSAKGLSGPSSASATAAADAECLRSRQPPKYGKGPYASVSKCIMKAETLAAMNECGNAAASWNALRDNSPAPTAKPPSATDTTLTSALLKPPTIDLETITDTTMGFTMSLPKGSKDLGGSRFSHSFSYTPPGQIAAIVVNVNPGSAKNLDDANKQAEQSMLPGTKAITKTEIDKGSYLIVGEPHGVVQHVVVFAKGKGRGAALRASCFGPSAQKDKLVEMCQSLHPTK